MLVFAMHDAPQATEIEAVAAPLPPRLVDTKSTWHSVS